MFTDINVYPLLDCGLVRLTGQLRSGQRIDRVRVKVNGSDIGEAGLGEPLADPGGGGLDHFIHFDRFIEQPGRQVELELVAETGGRSQSVYREKFRLKACELPEPVPDIDPRLALGDLPAGIESLSGTPLKAPTVEEVPDAAKHSTVGFFQGGQRKSAHAVRKGYLTPASSVLDVGCGLGVLASFCGPYLDPRQGGLYWGFDVRQNWIDWCTSNITSRYPHLRFFCAKLHFSLQKAQAMMPARMYRFPFPDASFDFIVLNSVFTHMLPEDVAAYMKEIARVLKPGGACQITYFLLDEETRAASRRGDVRLPRHRFVFDYGRFSSSRKVRGVEGAIAYDRAQCEALYRSNGLTIEEIRPGAWARAQLKGALAQDFVFARKPA